MREAGFSGAIRAASTSAPVLIVSDRVNLAQALRWVIEDRGLGPVAIAGTAHEAVRALPELHPALAIVDLDLPEVGGIALGRLLRERRPDVRLLGLASVNVPDGVREQAVRGGFDACPGGRVPLADILDAIAALLAEGRAPVAEMTEVEAYLPTGITPREREVLELIARGAGSTQIAHALRISPNTVRSHVQNIRAKLGASSRLEAVWLARRRGILRVPA